MLERSHLPAVYLFMSRLFVLTKQLRISDEDNRPYKIIEDDHVVIIRNGEKYDVTGKTLAAFIGDDCCGIAKFNDEIGLYWLYISPASNANDNVQLKFYSPKLKRIFVSSLTFHNDEHLGSISAPYTPTWKVAN